MRSGISSDVDDVHTGDPAGHVDDDQDGEDDYSYHGEHWQI
jgi:hypothetical protein